MSLKYEPASEPQITYSADAFRRRMAILSRLRFHQFCIIFVRIGYGDFIDKGIMALGGVPREQKMLQGHLPRVIYHQVY